MATQATLQFEQKKAPKKKRVFDEGNQLAASIILEDLEKYGEGSLMVEWARKVLECVASTK